MPKSKIRKVLKKIKKVARRAGRNKLGRRLRGHGAYSAPPEGKFSTPATATRKTERSLIDKVIAPFVDDTASKGWVNRGARWAGEFLGNKIPIPGIGRYLGNAASSFARMLGFGKYHVRQNSLIGAGQFKGMDSGFLTNSAPTFYNGNGANVRLRHKELLSTLQAANTFTLKNYLLNPANPTMFTWLNQMANMYEQYRFHGMVIEYKPNASFVATGGSLGFVNMATDYDAYDANFASKLIMDTQEYSTDGSVVDHFIHPIECDPNRNFAKNLWITSSSTVGSIPGGDARLYFLGNFQVAISGTQATGDIGELWVHYDVEFERPTAESAAPSTSFSQHAYGTATAVTTPNGADAVITSNLASTIAMTAAPYAPGVHTAMVIYTPQLQHYPGTYLVTTYVATNTADAAGVALSTTQAIGIPSGSTAVVMPNVWWDGVAPVSNGHDFAVGQSATGGNTFTCSALVKLVDASSQFLVATGYSGITGKIVYWDHLISPWNGTGFKSLREVEIPEKVDNLLEEFKKMREEIRLLRSGKDEADVEEPVKVEEPETPEPPCKAILSVRVPETPNTRVIQRK